MVHGIVTKHSYNIRRKRRNEKLLTQTLLIITSGTFLVDLVLLYNKFDWHVLAYVSNGSKEHQIFSP